MEEGRLSRLLSRAKRLDSVVDVNEETVKIVVFTLAGDYYAFNGEDVKEILPRPPISYVPDAPDYILGLINVRGDIESVIGLNHFLGLALTEPAASNRIIVAFKGDIRSGVLVDAVSDVVDVPVSAVKPPLSTLGSAVREFVSGVVEWGGKSIAMLDVGRIFGKMAA